MIPCGLEVLALGGLRCTGKSTVGRLVARHTGARFIDLDLFVAAEFELPGAGEVIDRHGLDAFREAEAAALARAVERTDPGRVVVATGGGVVETPEARRVLAGSTCAFWLHAPTDVLVARMKADGTWRPSLTGADPADEFRELEARRRDLYREVARRAFEATAPPDDLAMRITSAWIG